MFKNPFPHYRPKSAKQTKGKNQKLWLWKDEVRNTNSLQICHYFDLFHGRLTQLVFAACWWLCVIFYILTVDKSPQNSIFFPTVNSWKLNIFHAQLNFSKWRHNLNYLLLKQRSFVAVVTSKVPAIIVTHSYLLSKASLHQRNFFKLLWLLPELRKKRWNLVLWVLY